MDQKNTDNAIAQVNFTDLDPTQGLQAAKELISRKNQDGTVIIMKLDESTSFYKIDGLAAEVWENLVQRNTLENLLKAVKTNHPGHHSELETDVPKFVVELLNKKLITYC